MDARTEDLINAALDGELGAHEMAELDERLSRSPEARAYQASLQRLDQQLRSLPQQDVPADLHEQITSAVTLPAPAEKRVATRRVSAWPGIVRYGLAASLGLAVAIGFYEIQPGLSGPADHELMTGTIAPDKRSQLPIFDEYAFSSPASGLSSRVALFADAGKQMLDVTVESDEPVEIRIYFVSAGMRFGMPDRPENFSVADGQISTRSEGRRHFSVHLHRKPDIQTDAVVRIRIEYRRDGMLIEQRELSTRFD